MFRIYINDRRGERIATFRSSAEMSAGLSLVLRHTPTATCIRVA